MLLLEGYISNFTCARYYFLYLEFSGFYVNQSLAGQTLIDYFLLLFRLFNLFYSNPSRIFLKLCHYRLNDLIEVNLRQNKLDLHFLYLIRYKYLQVWGYIFVESKF
jgi:hypothetical protein